MEIVVAQEDYDRVPFRMNARTPLTVQVGNVTGQGVFLYQERNKPYISQAFTNGQGVNSLAHALETLGLKPNDPVRVEITGSEVRISRWAEGGTDTVVRASAPPAETVQPSPRRVVSVERIVRDTEVVRRVKALHGCRCQVCGHVIQLPDGGVYAEGHHVHPLGAGGPDVEANVLCVCPNHHAELDLGLWDIEVDKLRQAEGHTIGEQYVRHHNEIVRRRWTI
jgi:hypothetical protein